MSPAFADACDPIFTRVISILERIELRESVDRDFERRRIESLFQEAEGRVPDKAGWELARYALAAWIDDLLVTIPWDGASWWKNNSLEFAFFKSQDRATVFFTKAKEAAELTKRDALEVFYLCVVLGFRGLYSLDDAGFIAESLGLPPRLESWAELTAQSLHLRQGRPPISESPRPPTGAAPLEGKLLLVGFGLIAVILAAAVGALRYLTSL